jgi:glycerol-3-phosphate acyltransferase PlsY
LQLPGVAVDPALDRSVLTHALAFGAVLGHVYPVWFDFRGGKGGATAAGVLIALAPKLGILVIGLWMLVIAFTGYVGLATITAAAGTAVVVGLTQWPAQRHLFFLACLIAVLIGYTHRANIQRMLAGTESRMGSVLRRR